MSRPKLKTKKQCKSCPWRVGAKPDSEIPNYQRDLHHRLCNTIQSGLESLVSRRVMACHYSKPGAEIPCAGWLDNQIGAGNNIGVRLAVATGKLPVPEVDGPQYDCFEDTIPGGGARDGQ